MLKVIYTIMFVFFIASCSQIEEFAEELERAAQDSPRILYNESPEAKRDREYVENQKRLDKIEINCPNEAITVYACIKKFKEEADSPIRLNMKICMDDTERRLRTGRWTNRTWSECIK